MLGMGKKLRLSKLFNNKTGTAIIIPMDHAIEAHFDELVEPRKLIAAMSEAGVNGFLTRTGLARYAGEAFGGAGWVQRLTGRTGIAVSRHAELDLDQQLLGSVEQAMRNGADAVVPTFFLGGPHETRVLPQLGALSDKCAELGMPLLAEVFPVGEADAVPYNGPYSVDDMRLAVRFACETGSDVIKTWYSGDAKSFRKIVAYSTNPVLIAGGPKAENERQVLEMVKGAMDAGAKGTTVGRKIWQSRNPAAMVRAVSMIVHEGADVSAAMRALK
jgi:DhnA family fructose-bisphosphate aldolase class Ia